MRNLVRHRDSVGNSYATLPDYFRTEIEMDTAHDARHLLSVLKSVYPLIRPDFLEGRIELRNLRNHMGKSICITYKTLV